MNCFELRSINVINCFEFKSFLTKNVFIPKQNIVVEIGGKNTWGKQIPGIEHAYVVKDNIEYAFQNKIPLWMFGLLYWLTSKLKIRPDQL